MTFQNNAIFWIDTEKIKPNPYQPRREFDEHKLNELAESIRQYGVLQPLTVTRTEIQRPDGGLITEYELIAGERRLRASRIAQVKAVPAIIREGAEDERVKLEIAIIENLQREDLNPVDRARAFKKLVDEFNFTHNEVGKKVGKSRVYVSNTIRLLNLTESMQQALAERRITEGHTRPLLMLVDRPEQQETLFREILLKKMGVRDAELIARKIAYDRARKYEPTARPDIVRMEEVVSESLGTRVQVKKMAVGGRIMIDFVTDGDLKNLMETLKYVKISYANKEAQNKFNNGLPESNGAISYPTFDLEDSGEDGELVDDEIGLMDDEIEDDQDDEMYSISNFSI
jgi:ParB family chromosome partitioning protein